MHDNSLCRGIIYVSERSEAGIDSQLRFVFQSARSIGAQLADVFRRHAKLDGHHQYVVVGVVASIMSLDMPEHALLQKPLHLSAVHRIASQAVNLPTDNALSFALLNPLQHFVEDRTAGLLGGAFF